MKSPHQFLFPSALVSAFTSAFTSLFLLSSFSLSASSFSIGRTREHKVPSAVQALVQDGDTVLIDAGLYAGDVCVWTRDRLVLKAVGGDVILPANGQSAEKLGIWILRGADCTVEGITFSEFTSTVNASAAVYVEGKNVSIRNCVFRANNNGVWVRGNVGSRVVIEGCEFDANGQNSSALAGAYVLGVASLVFRSNYCHDSNYGSQVRTNASFNKIEYNRFVTSITRTTDRVLDLSNGGFGLINGNIFEQVSTISGQVVIGFGLGGLVHQCEARSTDLFIDFNTFVCRAMNSTVVKVADNTRWVIMPSNIYVNVSKILDGYPRLRDTTRGVRVASVSQVGFVDAERGDYHLRDDAIARLKAAAEDGYHSNLCADWPEDRVYTRPFWQYRHPRSLEPRGHGFDCGAYESYASTDVPTGSTEPDRLRIAPNPAEMSITLTLPPCLIGTEVFIVDMQGSEVARYMVTHTAQQIDVASLAQGAYVVRCGTYTVMFYVMR